MWTQMNTALVVIILTLLSVYHKALAIKVNPAQISVTEGESFTFSCGPSNDPLESISVTLNENEQPLGRVNLVNRSDDDIMFYQYRSTTFEDHNTRIVCSAGSDRGIIRLSVFYGPRIDMAVNSFTTQEGMTLSIPLSIDANPQPDPFTLYYQNFDISIAANSSVIEFTDISRDQAGNYSLKISNNISTVMYTFTVDVTYGPEFTDSELPTLCLPIDSSATYNCSEVSEVVGNPQPSLTANVTQSNSDLVTLSADTVIVINGSIDHSVTIACTADNGVGEAVTAFGSLNFGRVPDAVDTVSVQKVADYSRVNITWREQTDAGCSVEYQGKVIQLDSHEIIKTFQTTGNSVAITNLNPASQYLVTLSAVNELGSSDPINIEVMTKELELVITALNAERIDSNSVNVTWDFMPAGVTYLTAMIVYQRIDNEIPPVNVTRSVSADDRMVVLDLESSSRYKITLHIVATYTDLVATNSTVIDADITTSMIDSSGRNQVSKLLITLVLVLVILFIL